MATIRINNDCVWGCARWVFEWLGASAGSEVLRTEIEAAVEDGSLGIDLSGLSPAEAREVYDAVTKLRHCGGAHGEGFDVADEFKAGLIQRVEELVEALRGLRVEF